MAFPPTYQNGMESLQMKTVGKEQEMTEKNNDFLQTPRATEGARRNLLRKITKTDHILNRSTDDVFSENPQTDLLHEMDNKRWNKLELEAEHDQDRQREQDKQETDTVHEDAQESTSLRFSEESVAELSQEHVFLKLNYWNAMMGQQVKELGDDHLGWMEKINNIMQKINVTESTVKSLLNEVISLEGQTENLKGKDRDSDQEAIIEADACNEAHELKEKLVEKIENFCKNMTVLNTNLGMYQMQERKTDSPSPEEMVIEEIEPLLPLAPPPPLVQNSPPHGTVWKRALRIFVMFYVLTFTGLSCYTLFFDATFIFETLLPRMLGRRVMWELRDIIAPFLHLEVEDLLPS
ncbi:single-pass membrane and coiled-coil domain-containing protein 2 isoform X2 [Tupaia chinensis]|uniref:single-pass membrane and coiled-coil domain-containing protein 2 isoform X2 n=1 Tax=Tupaia chinensis TaxID=246437 RepID=UPI0003C8EFBE|nr:single-pass membrane and coiled-coil domain-containing protein 2 isoform X2 [Tupaia chinensis]